METLKDIFINEIEFLNLGFALKKEGLTIEEITTANNRYSSCRVLLYK